MRHQAQISGRLGLPQEKGVHNRESDPEDVGVDMCAGRHYRLPKRTIHRIAHSQVYGKLGSLRKILSAGSFVPAACLDVDKLDKLTIDSVSKAI